MLPQNADINLFRRIVDMGDLRIGRLGINSIEAVPSDAAIRVAPRIRFNMICLPNLVTECFPAATVICLRERALDAARTKRFPEISGPEKQLVIGVVTDASVFVDEPPKNDGVIAAQVFRSVEKCRVRLSDLAFRFLDGGRILFQLVPISMLEPGPFGGVVAKPSAQSRARSNILQPDVDCCILLA